MSTLIQKRAKINHAPSTNNVYSPQGDPSVSKTGRSDGHSGVVTAFPTLASASSTSLKLVTDIHPSGERGAGGTFGQLVKGEEWTTRG